jgi:hypothetical protein
MPSSEQHGGPFPLEETVTGFVNETLHFDSSGAITGDIVQDHLTYTDSEHNSTSDLRPSGGRRAACVSGVP